MELRFNTGFFNVSIFSGAIHIKLPLADNLQNEKKNAGMIAVIFFAVIFIMFFVAKTSKLDKFIGNWKRIDKAEDTLSINKVFDAIIIFSGRRSVAAEFNEDKSILKAHLF